MIDDTPALHIKGRILLGPGAVSGGRAEWEVRDELWVTGGRITFERPRRLREITTVTGWALPGLVDAHCHVGLDAHGAVDRITAERQALTDRDAGALLLRDAGSPADTRWIDDREDLPRLIRAGRHIARTRRYIRNYAEEIEPGELAATVREQARRGDGWVKLVGDWIDRSAGDLAPAWDADTLAGAVAAAHAAGVRMTAHTFSQEAVAVLVRAGIDCVEHGTGLTEDLIDEMARRGTALVPTLLQVANFPRIAARAEPKFPRYAAHMRALAARFPGVLRAAVDAGVPIYAGTDAGGAIRHGLIAEEMLALHRAGMAPLDVLRAGSWGAREWLGFPGLVHGGLADLVAYPTDPRRDLSVLRTPDRIILRGRVVR